MTTIRTNNSDVKLHVGSKSAYKSTNSVVRSVNRQNTVYKENLGTPHNKVAGSGPYIAGDSPFNPPTAVASPFANFGSATLVAANLETTIVSYVVDSNQILYLQGFNACGDADATYTLYVDGQIVAKSRTSTATLTAHLDLLNGTPIVQAGVAVNLTVVCTTSGVDFYGTLLGYYYSMQPC